MSQPTCAFADILVDLECGHPLQRRFYDGREGGNRDGKALAMMSAVFESDLKCATCNQHQPVRGTELVRMGIKRGTPPPMDPGYETRMPLAPTG